MRESVQSRHLKEKVDYKKWCGILWYGMMHPYFIRNTEKNSWEYLRTHLVSDLYTSMLTGILTCIS